MAQGTSIEWIDAMWIDRGGRRVRTYRRQDPARPGKDRSPLEWHPPRIDSAALCEAIAIAAEAGWL